MSLNPQVAATAFKCHEDVMPPNRAALPSNEPDFGLFSIGYRTFSCPVCLKVVRGDKWDFRRHYRTHSGQKPHSCPYCPYKAIQMATIRRHIKSMHGALALPSF